MANRAFSCLLPCLLLIHPAAGSMCFPADRMAGIPAIANGNPEIPFRILQGHMIVVAATAKSGAPLNLMIDTGAERSVLRRGIADRLRLTVIPGIVSVRAFGRIFTSRVVIMPGLRLGPVFTSLPCLESDLPFPGIDGLIGLDLLHRYDTIQIDFQRRTIRLGVADTLESNVPLEKISPLLIVPVMVGGQRFRLSLDTGSDSIVIDDRKMGQRLRHGPRRTELRYECLAGETAATLVNLEDVRIGNDTWPKVNALILEGSRKWVDRNGTLAPIPLGIQRLQIDFRNRILSWNR